MHAEVVFTSIRVQTLNSTPVLPKKKRIQGHNTKVEKSEIDMKQGPEEDHKDILHLGLKRTAMW